MKKYTIFVYFYAEHFFENNSAPKNVFNNSEFQVK